MVDVRLLDRLRAVADRKRWTIGVRSSARCRRLSVALVGSEGRGLSSRPQVYAHRTAELAGGVRRLSARLRAGRGSPGLAAVLAALLAESEAALLEDFATQIAPVWNRVLVAAIDGPGLWCRRNGLTGRMGLCDAARLAELCGLNVADGFAARDLAQDGRGGPLLPIPLWMLLHDAQRNRALLKLGRRWELLYLPASRDASGATRIALSRPASLENASNDCSAEAEARQIAAAVGTMADVAQLVVRNDERSEQPVLAALSRQLPDVNIVTTAQLGVPAAALGAAGVALLGLLYVDFVPAAAAGLTGARTPRVLGRLTPGSLSNWHQLVRELAAAKPAVMTLRSAI
jgi:1,6-anhydro-N-acetylmuramate kinase